MFCCGDWYRDNFQQFDAKKEVGLDLLLFFFLYRYVEDSQYGMNYLVLLDGCLPYSKSYSYQFEIRHVAYWWFDETWDKPSVYQTYALFEEYEMLS